MMVLNVIRLGDKRRDRMALIPDILAGMRSRRLSPSLITFSTIIKGYCNKLEMSAALSYLDELYAAKLKPDEIVFSTLLAGCGKARLLPEAERVLCEIDRQHVQVNSQ